MHTNNTNTDASISMLQNRGEHARHTSSPSDGAEKKFWMRENNTGILEFIVGWCSMG